MPVRLCGCAPRTTYERMWDDGLCHCNDDAPAPSEAPVPAERPRLSEADREALRAMGRAERARRAA